MSFVLTESVSSLLEIPSSVPFSHSIMSDSLQPHGLQPPGLPVHHLLLEFTQTHVPPSHLLSFPSPPTFNISQHQGLFQWVSSSHQVAKVLEFQLQYQSFQWIFRTDFLLQHCSSKASIPRHSAFFLYSPTLTSISDYWKTLALTRWTFVRKVTSLLFNMAFRFPSRLLSKCSFLFLRYRLLLFFCYTESLLLHGLSLVAMSRGYSLRVVRGLLIAGVSPLAEHGLWGERSQQLRLLGSRAWAQWLQGAGSSYSEAREIFLYQGLNPHLPHWQADS